MKKGSKKIKAVTVNQSEVDENGVKKKVTVTTPAEPIDYSKAKSVKFDGKHYIVEY